MSRTRTQVVDDWARNFKACLSPESKLGSLRGAARDNCLKDVLKRLKVVSPIDLFEQLHQGELFANADPIGRDSGAPENGTDDHADARV